VYIQSLHSDYHILHKNLKSKNILIKNGMYKIIDFGMPKVMGAEEKEDDNNFMVPEILKKHFYDSKVLRLISRLRFGMWAYSFTKFFWGRYHPACLIRGLCLTKLIAESIAQLLNLRLSVETTRRRF